MRSILSFIALVAFSGWIANGCIHTKSRVTYKIPPGVTESTAREVYKSTRDAEVASGYTLTSVELLYGIPPIREIKDERLRALKHRLAVICANDGFEAAGVTKDNLLDIYEVGKERGW